MTDRQPSPAIDEAAPTAPPAPTWWRWTARTALLAAPLGLLSAFSATWADQRYVIHVLASCVNSPGMPALGQVATWAAPAIGLSTTVTAALLLRSATRAGRRVAGRLDPLLALLLFLAPLLLLVEVACCWKVQPDLAPRPHHCEGVAALHDRR
ncbi:hypothetical protein LN042_12870 [Kitasatospora sp. RB6PN24]|uniref:hypothetical protein n=1 Tax=Kitasatospora humi TaxID=2893891 RepID=UPI001E5AA015|nr:hypothetical protein [Kitasatospora humi]MCC9307973.1 hypothetical protein [Kitasatospora humi]